MDVDTEFRLHVDDLVRFATLLVGAADALDVVSEAVTSTLARGSLSEVDNVRAYWFRAVMNTAAGWQRASFRRRAREARFVGREMPVSESMPAAAARDLLAGLTRQQRAVVYLAYWHDWSPAVIASSLGVSEGTVRKQLARGRAELRKVLSE